MAATVNRRRAIPTVRTLSVLTRPRVTLPTYLADLSRRYGSIVRLRSPWRSMYLIDEPRLIEEILVKRASSFLKGRGTKRLVRLLGRGLLTSEQPEHLHRRRLIAPTFSRDRIDASGAVIVSATARQIETWRGGETIDVDAQMMELAFEIVATALFGADLSDAYDEIRGALNTAIELFPFSLLPFSELLDPVPIPPNRRFSRARAQLDRVVYRLIAERGPNGDDRGDLLSVLLATRDDAGRALDDAAIRDEAMTILLAGHETTANALAWTFYLLQRHPDVEAKLAAELESVLGNRDPTIGDVPSLRYVRAVFAETLRLYPPAWITSRRAKEKTTIGDIRIARGDIAIVSQYVTHRNPRYWRDPERFDPDRFLGESPQRFAYFPFGGGNRTCIGERFAWLEGTLAIATIARRVRLTRVDVGDVGLSPFITLRPASPIRARVEPRMISRLSALVRD